MSAPSLKVAKAFSHQLRAEILDHMMRNVDKPASSLSPSEIADEFDEPLGNVSYHCKVLRELGMIELVGTEPRRGALEHRYALTGEARKVLA